MSLSHSLSNALSGLAATSRMAETVSSNLANALTEGYGRREVLLSARSLGGQGGGVRVDGIARMVDRGVLTDRRAAESVMTASDLTAGALGRVERAIGAAGAEDGIAARLAALQSALTSAAANPSSDIALGTLRDRLTGLASGINAAAAAVQKERLAADGQIAGDISTLNRSLKALEEVNLGIAHAVNTGQDAAALMDQRQGIVDTIARIVPVREIDRPAGQIALVTTGGEVLIDGPAREYGFAPVHGMTADMTLASGALSGLTRDGEPVTGITLMDGGSLGAAFRLRDTVLPGQAAALDDLAADLIDRFTDPAVDPTLTATAPGLFTDAGARRDPTDNTGLAGRLAVNAAIDPARGGALWRLRDGIGATAAGPVGNATQLDAWADALGATTSGASFAERTASLTAGAGTARLTAEESQAYATGRYAALRDTELAGGVDSDAETALLLRIEQTYAANARVLTAIDDMIRTLMEI